MLLRQSERVRHVIAEHAAPLIRRFPRFTATAQDSVGRRLRRDIFTC